MTRASCGLALAALFTVAACSEQPVAPAPVEVDGTALFSKGRGGNGSPHFSTDGTQCAFDAPTGRLACAYQISGLASNSDGLGSLVGNEVLTWTCNYSDASRDYAREVRRLAIDFLYYADESGNARGEVEGTPPVNASCLTKFIGGVPEKPAPANIQFALNENSSPIAVPLLGPAGSWALSALVSTPKRGTQYVFYLGSWMPMQPPA